ncbi:MAG TPA: hypothetical protein VMH86_02940 [Rhizomicrobium sp.]|nr:hypothetical protein [Rhizomicrobium sp.]
MNRNAFAALVLAGELVTTACAAAPNNLGVAALAAGDRDRVFEQFSKAIAVDSAMWQAYSDRSGTYARRGAFDLALADCSSAIGLGLGTVADYARYEVKEPKP